MGLLATLSTDGREEPNEKTHLRGEREEKATTTTYY